MLQAQAWGCGHKDWSQRKCSKCWSMHAQMLAQQHQCTTSADDGTLTLPTATATSQLIDALNLMTARPTCKPVNSNHASSIEVMPAAPDSALHGTEQRCNPSQHEEGSHSSSSKHTCSSSLFSSSIDAEVLTRVATELEGHPQGASHDGQNRQHECDHSGSVSDTHATWPSPWEVKLRDLQQACHDAEDTLVFGNTLQERKTALMLAGMCYNLFAPQCMV